MKGRWVDGYGHGREIGGWEYELCDHTSNVSISPTSEEINREAAHNVDLAVVTAVIQIADSQLVSRRFH